jgi:serine/threonine-protein kinase
MPATATEPAVALSREQFLAGVRAAGVLGERQLARLDDTLTPFQKTAPEVADFLVKGDYLTRFQADRLLSGRTDGFLLGQYIVLDYRGKMDASRVYKARHRTMNRAVTIQVLKAELTATDAARDDIRGQARAAARLAHPNVVTLLDVNAAGDRMYLVQEFLDGTDFGSMVRASGPLPVARACEFVRQAAVGLHHAHEKGICHGRLTPDSILVGRPGGSGPDGPPVVKVDGLGLGRLADAADATSEFRAPERLDDPHRANTASDLYALGGVFHFLLTGHPPFPAADGKLQPVRYLRPDVPAAVESLLTTLLAKAPEDRPKSAEEVAVTLERFATSRDSAGVIDFAALVPTSGPVSGMAELTGLLRPDADPQNPWEEITAPAAGTAPTVDVSDHTPIVIVRRPRPAAPPTRHLTPRAAVTLGLTVGGSLGLLAALAVLLWRVLG